jgi:hypothetical protein
MLLALYQIEHVFLGDCFIYVWILVVLDKILGWQEISTQQNRVSKFEVSPTVRGVVTNELWM